MATIKKSETFENQLPPRTLDNLNKFISLVTDMNTGNFHLKKNVVYKAMVNHLLEGLVQYDKEGKVVELTRPAREIAEIMWKTARGNFSD